MSTSRQNSSNHSEALNNSHLLRTFDTESNNARRSPDDSSARPQRILYSGENGYTGGTSSYRTTVQREQPSEGARGERSYRYNDDEYDQRFRRTQFRQPEDNSYGFDLQRDAPLRSVVSRVESVPQRQPPTTYTSQPVTHTVNRNGRTCVIDINITVSAGGRAPETYVSTTNIRPSPTVRSTTTYDNVHYLDVDLRTRPNTATVSTDGYPRRSS